MNKFDILNQVMQSDLKSEDKCLLVELVLRMDEQGYCWPSVARLCAARGIKHEKNFKGADYYLPGLVTKEKKGRRNAYRINTPALAGVTAADVSRYQGSWSQRSETLTPSTAGVSEALDETVEDNTPSTAGVNTPAAAEVTPSTAGVDSTKNNAVDSSYNTGSTEPVIREHSGTNGPPNSVETAVTAVEETTTTTSSNYQEDSAVTALKEVEEVFVLAWSRLSREEKAYFIRNCPDESKRMQAVEAYGSIHSIYGWMDGAEKALATVGVEIEGW